MANLIIIPYISNHGKIIMASQLNHVISDMEKDFIKDCSSLEEKHMAFTCMINDKIIASAGIKRIWGKVGEGWVIAKYDISKYPITIAKAIKQNFDYVATSNNIKRVQTAVRADYKIGIRFAEWLGLYNEGLMKHYGVDGSDHYRYVRIF